MKQWPRKSILVLAACAMILVGVAPPAYIVWSDWQLMQLSVPISLHRGQYTSPAFTPKRITRGLFREPASASEGEYRLQVSLFREAQQDSFDVNQQWAVVDSAGMAIAQGRGTRFSLTSSGSTIPLGTFIAAKGSPLVVRVTLDRNLPALDVARPRLQVVELRNRRGLPLIGALAVFWALALAGTGMVILFVLALRSFSARSEKSG